MPQVSVVMASYNHEKFVGQAITSVLEQSFQDFELIITDDGSSDRTADVIRSFKDERIKLEVFPTNRGACVATNSAISRANGEFVAILNSDDYFLPGKLEKQVAILAGRPDLAALFGHVCIIDERGTPLPKHRLNDVFNREIVASRPQLLRHFFFRGNCLCHPTILIRRSCYEKIGPYDIRLRQLPDFDFWVRLCAASAIDVIPDRVTAFRVLDHERNTSGSRPDTLAAVAWEMYHVLPHFMKLDNSLFSDTFATEIHAYGLEGLDRRIQLGRIALTTKQISNQAFGLDLLYEAVTQHLPGITEAELNALSRKYDVFGTIARSELAKLKGKRGKRTYYRLKKSTLKRLSFARSFLGNRSRALIARLSRS